MKQSPWGANRFSATQGIPRDLCLIYKHAPPAPKFYYPVRSSKQSVAQNTLNMLHLLSSNFCDIPYIASNGWLTVNSESWRMWREIRGRVWSTVQGESKEKSRKITALLVSGKRAVFEDCQNQSRFASLKTGTFAQVAVSKTSRHCLLTCLMLAVLCQTHVQDAKYFRFRICEDTQPFMEAWGCVWIRRRPATSSVDYTTNCNTQSSAPEDG